MLHLVLPRHWPKPYRASREAHCTAHASPPPTHLLHSSTPPHLHLQSQANYVSRLTEPSPCDSKQALLHSQPSISHLFTSPRHAHLSLETSPANGRAYVVRRVDPHSNPQLIAGFQATCHGSYDIFASQGPRHAAMSDSENCDLQQKTISRYNPHSGFVRMLS
jgi:hypothetical protein